MRVDASVGHNLCPEAMESLFRELHQHWVVVAGEQSLAKDHATIMIVGPRNPGRVEKKARRL